VKSWKLAALAIVSVTSLVVVRDPRSVIPWSDKRETPGPFNAEQSAALFVGVRQFAGDETPNEVPYAVDDAIDLAWRFALDPRVKLVRPEKVVLALSGAPVKEESKRRLGELRAAGAAQSTATQENVLELLDRQKEAVGRDGIFIVTFATHGFISDGTPYVLGATSTLGRPDTALSANEVLDIAARANRSLVLMDACRERIPAGARGPRLPDVAGLIRRRSNAAGQAVLYAPTWAFDDHVSRNGVFTKAVLDGLDCQAGRERGAVTVETLSRFVNRQVSVWLQKNRRETTKTGIQTIMDGGARLLPLSACKPAPPVRGARPMSTSIDDSILTALDKDDRALWRRDLRADVIGAEAADLDGDGRNEVVAGTRGRIVAFDANGNELWSVATALRDFAILDVYGKDTRQVVALTDERLSMYDPNGKLHAELLYDGELQHMAVDRPTSRHAQKIVLAAGANAFLLKPNKAGKYEWFGAVLPNQPIRKLEIVDADNDGTRDIVLHTRTGRVVLNFEGQVQHSEGVQFAQTTAPS
jgi:hypothetical protein